MSQRRRSIPVPQADEDPMCRVSDFGAAMTTLNLSRAETSSRWCVFTMQVFCTQENCHRLLDSRRIGEGSPNNEAFS
ncbi:hypothetical protein TNCV_2249891 [Trichonephila clavipes]|nr:hypothetical protein TNCV_2249891 [Trichonephila clavipes]